ncbi:recombinase family protein [Caballeronia sp.]|uniref:recombinase family protein n=1 Tax=Caballeronia sp. TaxID=1931223 RepID=UPI003C61B3BD
MNLFVYTNTGGDPDLRERDLIKIDASGFLIDMSRVFVDHCDAATPAALRMGLQQVIRRIAHGDTLVVSRLSYLGNGIADVVSSLKALSEKSVRGLCVELGNADLCAKGDAAMLRMLQLAGKLEADVKRARALEAAAVARREGIPQGRPASLSDTQRQQALRELAAGNSVTAVARALSTSRQTIIRVREGAKGPGAAANG